LGGYPPECVECEGVEEDGSSDGTEGGTAFEYVDGVVSFEEGVGEG